MSMRGSYGFGFGVGKAELGFDEWGRAVFS